MTSTATSRATKTETTRATKTRERRVAEIMAFADTSRMARKYEPGWFEKVETELDEKLAELGRDLKAEIMAGHDIDAEAIEIDGITHRRVLRASQTYVTTAGPVVVERWLYRERDNDAAKSVLAVGSKRGNLDRDDQTGFERRDGFDLLIAA